MLAQIINVLPKQNCRMLSIYGASQILLKLLCADDKSRWLLCADEPISGCF